MKRIALFSLALTIAACGSVYDRPVPKRNDAKALLDIRDHLKGDDKAIWERIIVDMNLPNPGTPKSKTVGELIVKAKARTACTDAAYAAVQKASEMVEHDIRSGTASLVELDDKKKEEAQRNLDKCDDIEP
jgi:hypothetical protein